MTSLHNETLHSNPCLKWNGIRWANNPHLILITLRSCVAALDLVPARSRYFQSRKLNLQGRCIFHVLTWIQLYSTQNLMLLTSDTWIPLLTVEGSYSGSRRVNCRLCSVKLLISIGPFHVWEQLQYCSNRPDLDVLTCQVYTHVPRRLSAISDERFFQPIHNVKLWDVT